METEFNALNGFFFTPMKGALEASRKIVFFNMRNRPVDQVDIDIFFIDLVGQVTGSNT